MSIGWPEGILLGFMALGVISYAILDGKPRTDTYNFSVKLIDAAITFGLLFWGGFFA